MSEQERIQALLKAGRITPQEAELLLSALEEGDEAERQAEETLDQNVGKVQVEPKDGPQWFPQGQRWVRIKLTAGQLEARLDPSLQFPQVKDGQAEVREVGGDLEVIPQLVYSSFLGGLMGGLALGSLELRIPPGWGLDLTSKAAQVEVEGLDFVRGRVTAGNIELDHIRGVDLEVMAGNIEGSLLLTEGEHRLKVSMGNAELDLLPGSSVQLHTGVSMGNLETRGFAGRSASPNLSTQPLNHQLGEGKARLDVFVRMGNLEIKAK